MKRTRLGLAAMAWALGACAAGGPDLAYDAGEEPEPDAPIVVAPDAPPAPLDARPPPDAPPGAPDAPPPPDAPPGVPDAGPMCGNAVREGAEECDDGNGINTDGCLNACLWARCGDGVVRPGVEQCDDGNTLSNDGCSAICLTCSGGDARFTWTGNSHCYARFDAVTEWGAARDACAAARTHLATFELAAENDAVLAALLGGSAQYWFGMNDLETEGMWKWVDDSPVVFTHWSAGEPNDSGGIEDCGVLYVDGFWNDLSCADPRGAICEDDGWIIRTEDRHAYKFVTRTLSWGAAVADCAMLGGHLATITSAGENGFLSPWIHGSVWLGGSDSAVEGTFTWATGEPFSYNGFAPGEPNDVPPGEDCIEFREGLGWNDQDCAQLRRYVCEVD